LVSGLNIPSGLAVSGGDLFVAQYVAQYNGMIGEYTTDGATVNTALISGLNNPLGLAVSSGDARPAGPG
jgi:hypothetical protein